jgi:UDP-N-acetyl-D-mannosaminuronate dehydrogenase
MSGAGTVLVVGLGEVGKPLLEVLSKHYRTFGLDVQPSTEVPKDIDVLHVCYPFRIPDFVGETAKYIKRFKPRVTVLNTTVAVGTTREVAEKTGARVANSPVRGKHVRMAADLLHYDKFIGALDRETGELVSQHFQGAGMKTRVFASPETTELAKLTETTYFGVMIAWAQEVERYCDRLGLSYDDVVSIYEEVPFFPRVKYFPGVIGGHCVMSNIEILSEWVDSDILDAIDKSNRQKIAREKPKAGAAKIASASKPAARKVGSKATASNRRVRRG